MARVFGERRIACSTTPSDAVALSQLGWPLHRREDCSVTPWKSKNLVLMRSV
jgi:hypothetical protein